MSCGLHATLVGRASMHLPAAPAETCVSPWPVPGVQNPFPRPDMSVLPFPDTESAWNFFFPKEEILFSKMGGESMLTEPSCFHRLTLLQLILLLEGKGKEAAFLKLCTSRTFSHTCVVKWHLQGAADTIACCSPVEAGEGEARTRAQVPRTAPAGDQGQNASTEKVERLTDNRRGSSVVIYNRDCKMAN